MSSSLDGDLSLLGYWPDDMLSGHLDPLDPFGHLGHLGHLGYPGLLGHRDYPGLLGHLGYLNVLNPEPIDLPLHTFI
jgi:hypothetical protein